MAEDVAKRVAGDPAEPGAEHPTRPAPPRRDAGVATVVACLCAAALLAVTVVVVRLAGATVAARRAAAAADLGALAGASRVLEGSSQACAHAASVVAANRAVMSDCEVLGFDVRVQATVTVRLGPMDAVASARARAGPDTP